MVDIVDKATRSRMMAGIGSKDTKPEIVLRRILHARGLRYRLHCKQLPGRPDIVFPKFRAAVFVHGCFWHRHKGCKFATTPATRPDFWNTKFETNLRRDKVALEMLRQSGWRTAIVWECAVKGMAKEAIGSEIANWLVSDELSLVLPQDLTADYAV